MDEFIEEVTAYVRRILLSHDLVCFVNYHNEFLAIFLNLYLGGFEHIAALVSYYYMYE
jgi:hypothetical protein